METHKEAWHTHPNPQFKPGNDQPLFILVHGFFCVDCVLAKKLAKKAKSTLSPATISYEAAPTKPVNPGLLGIKVQTSAGRLIPIQVSENKVKPNSIGYPLAMEFIRLAKENQDYVTYEQCEKMCPAYPTDPASWARAMGLQIQTERKNRRYKVIKYV